MNKERIPSRWCRVGYHRYTAWDYAFRKVWNPITLSPVYRGVKTLLQERCCFDCGKTQRKEVSQ